MNIQATTNDAYELMHRGILALQRAEQAGLRLDLEYCATQNKKLTHHIKYQENKFAKSELGQLWKKTYRANMNFGSGQQLAFLLYNIMKLTPTKFTQGEGGSTDEEALTKLELPGIQHLIRSRKLKKLRDTYLASFIREQVDGILHPNFNLHLVKTFRPSTDHPNLANVPNRDYESMKLCRGAIFPRIGHQFLSGDFGGIEVKMACCYTEDPQLIHDVNHGDMHLDMAVELFKLDNLDKSHKGEGRLRQGAKNGFVFPQFYGDYWGNNVPSLLDWAKEATLKDGTPGWEHLQNKKLITLDRKGNIKSRVAFEKHVQQVEDVFWNTRYRVYTKWKKKWWAQYQKKGYIEMFTGFRCGGSVMRENECINAPFQGTAFHCMLWTLIQLDQYQQERGWRSRIVNQIYDEIMFDAHPEETKKVARQIVKTATKELPAHYPWINVPLEIDIESGAVDTAWGTKNEMEM